MVQTRLFPHKTVSQLGGRGWFQTSMPSSPSSGRAALPGFQPQSLPSDSRGKASVEHPAPDRKLSLSTETLSLREGLAVVFSAPVSQGPASAVTAFVLTMRIGRRPWEASTCLNN